MQAQAVLRELRVCAWWALALSSVAQRRWSGKIVAPCQDLRDARLLGAGKRGGSAAAVQALHALHQRL